MNKIKETVIVTLTSGTGYDLSGSSSATITIESDEVAPVVTSNNSLSFKRFYDN